jgi:hypothetical protein
VHPVNVHVDQTRLRVVTAGDHLVKADGINTIVLRFLTCDGVEPDIKIGPALVLPRLSGREAVASRSFYNPRAGIEILAREPVGPHARMLDQMVVHR